MHKRIGDCSRERCVPLYAVKKPDGTYFAGFDNQAGVPKFVSTPLNAKLYTNKFDVPLRPDEELVEICVELTSENTHISAPFRPKRRTDPT
jgi:hypothetical protein